FADTLAEIEARYTATAGDLLDGERAQAVLAAFAKDITDIHSVLKALSLVGAASPRSRALVAGFGELWSARLLAATLARRVARGRSVVFVDARKVLVIEPGE